MSAFAAVDLGASSGRVIVGNVDDGRVALHEVNRFPNGPVQVAGALHWDVLGLYRGVLDGLRAAGREAGVLSGVGIDSWAVDYGLLDGDGALVGNPFHYRDGRTDGVPEKVFTTVPAAELYARTGLQVQPFNTVFQLVAAQGTAALAAARSALLIPDLLGCWLTGARVAEVTNASTTGLLDASSRTWATDLAERLGIDSTMLPPLLDPGALLGHVRADVGLHGSVPVWTVGSHDTASAVVAVPAVGDDFAYISCGTWSLVGLELDQPVLTEASRAANFTNEAGVDGTVRYLRNVMGLWVLQESIRTWNEAGLPADLPDLLAAAARVPALTTVVDLDGPTFLPPGDMPARIADEAVRTGQTPPQSQAETVRCILDSLALAYRRAVRQAADLADRSVDVVHVVGGGVRNELLCQLTADATGLPVVAGPVEGAALGNVLVQARAAGVLSGGLADLRAVGARGLELRRYEPGATGGPTDRQWSAAERRVDGP
ncbi:rhamnulokinase family protein [Cellulomonas sp. Leaf334]|uniref:rhamnulokinase n=1 Tax=Cellulomonas sp. Leaf334 TaxID=1736339 RepID=UPI0006F721C3|nr:rhamnulokinase family protein [Cellulomonas sp. Leaf334]KQR08410.1 carbohydrate kinase [Cellulomonas sp. Leaf334]